MTVRHVANELLRITLANGAEPVVLTPGHPLYVEGQGWTAARDVVDGDVLRSDSGPVDVKSVESVEAGRAVYNVEVAREHTYRVSTSKVWAHNQCPGGGAARGGAKLRPDSAAEGPHSTFKQKDGNVSGYAEWTPNHRNPSGFDQAKRVDTQYANPHTDRGFRRRTCTRSRHQVASVPRNRMNFRSRRCACTESS